MQVPEVIPVSSDAAPPTGARPCEEESSDVIGGTERDTGRDRIREIRERGDDPFGARFPRTHYAAEVRQGFKALEGHRVRVAGRLVGMRRMGGVAFADLLDRSGSVQLFLRSATMGAAAYGQLLADVDVGDFLGADGDVCRTRSGEVSVCAASVKLLTKALRPLPAKWHGLHDAEVRQRQRYLDLVANADVRQRFINRSRMMAAVRRYLDGHGYLEVETPVLHAVAGGAAARPFKTHHNALDLELHLRVALELHLKRLIVGGLDAVYEIGRVFRNEGLSTRHNPEFTMLECYRAFADYTDMMDLTEGLFAAAAQEVCGTTQLVWQGREIDLRGPWQRVSMIEALAALGLDPLGAPDEDAVHRLAAQAGVMVPPGATRGQVIDSMVDKLVLPQLLEPTFLIDHPLAISPLARARPEEPRIALRFEAIIGGMEMANAFTELNDPDEQRQRFVEQIKERDAGNEEAQLVDEDFLRALEHGMPPTGGLGVGLDRLAMLLCDVQSIRDVILFPLLRPRIRP